METWISLGMIVVLFAVFYFVGIRPQKKQEKETNQMRNNLQVGDEITTIGVIIGKIVRTKIRKLKSAVSRVDVKAEHSVD